MPLPRPKPLCRYELNRAEALNRPFYPRYNIRPSVVKLPFIKDQQGCNTPLEVLPGLRMLLSADFGGTVYGGSCDG
jgi:hypothetical protein